MDGEQNPDQTAPDTETRARSMGWTDKDSFRGDPEKWVDAETFVKRGEEFMPILRSNNKVLERRLQEQAAEMRKLQEQIAAGQESIQALTDFHAEATARAVAKAKTDLLAELKVAKRDGDVDREVEIGEALDEVRQQEADIKAAKATKAAKPPAPAPGQPQADPAFAGWMSDNPWFGVDTRKTNRAMGIAQELRGDEAYDTLQGREFYDKVVEVMEQRAGTRAPAPSKVNGGGRPSTTSGSSGTGYDSLPAEAKAVCDRQASKLVGEGRAFKDQAAWRAHYAKIYFSS